MSRSCAHQQFNGDLLFFFLLCSSSSSSTTTVTTAICSSHPLFNFEAPRRISLGIFPAPFCITRGALLRTVPSRSRGSGDGKAAASSARKMASAGRALDGSIRSVRWRSHQCLCEEGGEARRYADRQRCLPRAAGLQLAAAGGLLVSFILKFPPLCKIGINLS